jgi:hypothetical protein
LIEPHFQNGLIPRVNVKAEWLGLAVQAAARVLLRRRELKESGHEPVAVRID